MERSCHVTYIWEYKTELNPSPVPIVKSYVGWSESILHAHINTYTFTLSRTHTHSHVFIPTHMYMHTHKHTHLHTYTCTHVRTYSSKPDAGWFAWSDQGACWWPPPRHWVPDQGHDHAVHNEREHPDFGQTLRQTDMATSDALKIAKEVDPTG